METTFVIPSFETQRNRQEIVMTPLRILFLFIAVLIFGSHSASATDYAVGTCEPKLHSYSTISEAVSTVPAGSIVEVCPGTYPEQVTISQPLTLEGITSANSDKAIITSPSGGLSVNGPGESAVQILVTAGPVNITNIMVDGTGNDLGGTAFLAGIYYGNGSSGVIKEVTTRNQLDSDEGVGIWVENEDAGGESVTIENCSVHDFDFAGIIVGGDITVTVKANHVNASSATKFLYGIYFGAAAGSMTGNDVNGPGTIVDAEGISVASPSVSISANIIANWQFAVFDSEAASYTSNTVRNVEDGFYLTAPGATVESNTITQVSNVGIEFNCNTGTVKSNTIDDAHTGLADVPTGLSSTDAYFSAGEISTACVAGAALPNVTPRRPPTPDRP